MGYNITSASIPDLDEWGWDNYWSCPEWVQWHQALVADLGKTQADIKFVEHWFKQTTGAHALDCRSFNGAFRTYFKSQNLLEALYGNLAALQLIGVGTDVINAAASGAGSLVSGAGSLFEGFENTAKVLKYLLPVLAVGVLGFGLYLLVQRFK